MNATPTVAISGGASGRQKFICVDLRDADVTADLRSCRRNGQGKR